MCIEDLGPVASIEAFDVGVLIGLARLDVLHGDAAIGAPVHKRLRQQFGQNVIVESRAGASGSIGTGYVAQQPGNGCTILLSYDTHGVNPALYPLPFDTVTAFKPVMLIGTRCSDSLVLVGETTISSSAIGAVDMDGESSAARPSPA